MERKIQCLDCKTEIIIKKEAVVGDVIECTNCGAEMEIINLEPLEVSLIEEEK